jgi:uncharacterized membrane protein
MTLSETGESRVRGYLYVLERALRTSLPRDIAADAAREVESHIRERVAQSEPQPDERTALERLLAELGPPLKVAQAYSIEMAMEEAVTTGRAVAVARSVLHMAASGVMGFFGALGLFVGYVLGLSFVAIAVLKPIFPDNVGIFVVNGIPRSLGAQFPRPEGAEVFGGYWIIPLSAMVGLGILLLTHRAARRWISTWMGRRGGKDLVNW